MLAINNLSQKIHSHSPALLEAVQRVLASGRVILGPEVNKFETDFAAYLGARHCISLANGTEAIELGLKALGVEPNTIVATIANASMYTTTALLAIGAEPYFMDVDPLTHETTLNDVEKAIQSGVKAVVITHLYGRIVPDTPCIAALYKEKGVHLFEDCAQAHGAMLNGQKAGTFGEAASFSFYPTKNLGGLGDGGAVVTNNDFVAENVKALRQYGWKNTKYEVAVAKARNSRLDELQAAILSVFLPFLDIGNQQRTAIANFYSANIRHPLVRVPPLSGEEYVAHLYVVCCPERDSLLQHLVRAGITADIHYPIPDHRQPVFNGRYAHLKLPHTEKLACEILTLPCYPEMPQADVEYVVDTVHRWRR